MMNFPFYVAHKIARSSASGFSGIIIKIAIASIALSVSVMILSTSVILGFKQQITEKIFGFWGHIHITDTNINRSFEQIPILNEKALKDSIMSIEYLEYSTPLMRFGREVEGKYKRKRTKGGVERVYPYVLCPGLINTGEEIEGIVLKGLNDEYNWEDFSQYIKEGHPLTWDTSEPSREILVSEQTLQRLQLEKGSKIILHFVKNRNQVKRVFNIAGVYRTGLEEYDRRFAFVDMRVLQDILNWSEAEVAGLELHVEHIPDTDPLADYIYQNVLPPHLYTETIQEKFPNIFEWLELQDINESIIMLLMVIVAIINMATAIIILILERSKMIGILKSLGQKNWSIRKIFIYNAAWILGFALIIGNSIGLGLGILQKMTGYVKLDEANYYLSTVPISVDISTIILINIGTVVLTLVFMVLPTLIIERISPIKIIRFD